MEKLTADGKAEVLRLLKKAPRGKRGQPGHLIHLQDPQFITNDAQLLMTRPTLALKLLLRKVADRIQASQTIVKTIIAELTDAGVVGISTSRKSSGLPTLIPIKYEKGHLTANIGTFNTGQFAGFNFRHDRNLSVLHIFDKFGFHVESSSWDEKDNCDPKEELASAISNLLHPYPGDVAVQLFSVTLMGTEYGLIAAGKNRVEYTPLNLRFGPPWDGSNLASSPKQKSPAESNLIGRPYVYDKAKYHRDSVQRDGLDQVQTKVHTAFFLGWLIDNDLISAEELRYDETLLDAYKSRKKTAIEVYDCWDCCLVDDMLTDQGNAFARAYFDFESGKYLADYHDLLVQDLPNEFHVPYTWENYEILRLQIDQRYQDWCEAQKSR